MTRRAKVIVSVLAALLVVGLLVFCFGYLGGASDDEKTDVSNTMPSLQPIDPERMGWEQECATDKDRLGRPGIAVRDRLGSETCEHLPDPKDVAYASKLPNWVLRGKKIWADDGTPCPYPILALRCDEVRFSVLAEGEPYCYQGVRSREAYKVEIIEDDVTGDFILMGVGDGPVMVGTEFTPTVDAGPDQVFDPLSDPPSNPVSRLIRASTIDRGQGVFVEDPWKEHFVLV